MKRPSKGWCDPCLYYGKSTDTCDYILMEDHRRPCPAGYGCIARRLRKDVRKSMNPKWDTAIGKEMFLGGRSDREIADFFGIAVSTVSYQRRKNWEADSTPPPRCGIGGNRSCGGGGACRSGYDAYGASCGPRMDA